MSYYTALITAATEITDAAEVAAIEDYMRNVYFHSTLDWQTKPQLVEAARIAASDLRFENAVSHGALSFDETADNYLGLFMFMYTKDGVDYFKNRNTRRYLEVQHAAPVDLFDDAAMDVLCAAIGEINPQGASA